MRQHGFSLLELVIAIVLIGLIAALAFPRLGRQLGRRHVQSARSAVAGLHARGRATAIQRGRAVRLVRNGNQLLLISDHPVTGVPDTIDRRDFLASYGVTVTSSRDVLAFDPRGFGTEPTATTIVVARGGQADTLTITAVGSVVR